MPEEFLAHPSEREGRTSEAIFWASSHRIQLNPASWRAGSSCDVASVELSRPSKASRVQSTEGRRLGVHFARVASMHHVALLEKNASSEVAGGRALSTAAPPFFRFGDDFRATDEEEEEEERRF